MAEKKKSGKGGIRAGDHSVVVGGSVKGSNIIVGDNNVVSNQKINLSTSFAHIYHFIERHPNLPPSEKQDAKEELKEIQAELEKPEPDEGFLARRFRNLQRMAPDIVEVAMETLKNPLSGMAEVVKKVARKMADEAGAEK
jgi:hypothetical protein